MSNDQQRFARVLPPGMVVPGAFILVLWILGYYTATWDLTTPRPRGEPRESESLPTPGGIRADHSRLWEDPFATIPWDKIGQTVPAAPSGACDLYRNLQVLFGCDWPKGNPEPYQGTFTAIVNKFRDEGSTRPNAGGGSACLCQPVIESIRAAVSGESKADEPQGEPSAARQILCMPVMVAGGPSEDDSEQRMRIRYAVLAALGTRHFQLGLPNRMSYVLVPIIVEMRDVGGLVKRRIAVPIKLFVPDPVRRDEPEQTCRGEDRTESEPFSAVLVCWINQTQLGSRPLLAICQILNELFSDDVKQQVAVRIIGPVGSDMLRTIAEEDAKWEDWSVEAPAEEMKRGCYGYFNCDGVAATLFDEYTRVRKNLNFGAYGNSSGHHPRLFSARSTISANSLTAECQRRFEGFNSLEDDRPCKLRLLRTIGSDWQLVRVLGQELKWRGAWPDVATGSKKKVLLITERDSVYGRAIGPLFKQELGMKGGVDPLLMFTYMRGLDGIAAGKSASKKSADDESDDVAAARDLPNGPAQSDYLRRLGNQIGKTIKDLECSKRDVVAVGVLGSDLYDKLVVLRLLRQEFPGACFFTTDLDARMFHPNEYPYTKNLVVASHFGLELHPNIQRDVPAFRDSYQTSVFMASLLALNDPRLEQRLPCPRDPWGLREEYRGWDNDPELHLRPLVFEIGRYRAHQLTLTEMESGKTAVSKVFQSSVRETPWYFATRRNVLLGLGSAAFLLLVGLAALPPLRRQAGGAVDAVRDLFRHASETYADARTAGGSLGRCRVVR